MAIERLDGSPHSTRAELLRLRRLAMRDELTGLANRRAFLQRLRDEIARARRHRTPFSLVLLDLDGLKDLNDTFGHQAGDAALKHFARALARTVRQEDMVARIGGDEFAVVAVHGEASDARPFVERIGGVAAGLARRVTPKARPVWVSAAWGAAVWEPGVRDAEELFARAEAALLAAKQAGSERPVLVPAVSDVYQPRGRRALGEELRRLLAMARDVSSARELEQLCRAAAEQAAALVGARMASLALRGPDGRTGYTQRLNDGQWLPADEWFADGHGLIGWVMVHGEPVVVNDLRTDTRADADAVQRFNARKVMCLPLRGQGGRTLGVLSLTNKLDEQDFSSADVELGIAFADLVVSAIENVRAREEAEDAHSYLKSLMDQAHDAIYITDPDTRRILDVNAAAERMSGYSRDELLTMRAPDLRPPEDRDGPGTTDLARASDGVLTIGRRHLRKDGTRIPVEVSARMITTPRGRVVLHIVRDVRARVAAEESLQRRARDLQARNDVAAVLASTRDSPGALTRAIDVVLAAVGADGGLLAACDPETGALRAIVDRRVPEPLRGSLLTHTYRTGDGLIGAAMAGQAVLVEDTQQDPRVRRAETLAAGVRSLALVPMRVHGQVRGVLAVGAYAPHRFDRASLALLQALGDQVALWQENQRLLAAAQAQEDEARFLADLGDALNRARTVRQVVRLLVRRAGARLGHTAAVLLRDQPTDSWNIVEFSHPKPGSRAAIARLLVESPPRPTGGITDLASRSPEPLIVDVGAGGMSDLLTGGIRRLGVETMLLAPLRAGNRTLGVFVTGAARGERFTEQHRRLAAEICRHASVALANVMAREDLLARNRELRLMNAITAVAQRSGTAAELYASIVRRLHRAFRPAGAVLRLWDEQEGVLRLAATAGFSDEIQEALARQAPRLGERLAGRVAQTREALLTCDITQDPRFDLSVPPLPGFRAMMAVPLELNGRLIGVLSIISLRPNTFDAGDLRLLTHVSGPMASALARIQAAARAEAASRYSRALIDHAPDAIFVVDPATRRIVDTNPAAERLTGYTRTELLGMEDRCLQPVREWRTPTSSDLALRLGTFTNRVPACIRRKDGTEVQIEVSASLVERAGVQVVLNAVRDVTERVAGEVQLRFQSQVLASVRDAVIAMDHERRVIYWNSGATELFGWTADELLGCTLECLAVPGQYRAFEDAISRALADGNPRFEALHLRKDGRQIWCSLHLSTLHDERGQVSGVLAVVRDVTAQREAEQALAHARDAAARRAAEFAAAAQASRAVVGGGTPRTQLERLVRHIIEVTGFDAAVVFSCHARDRQLCVEAVHHQRTDALPGLAALLGTRWTGEELLGFTPPSHGGLVQVIPSVSGAPLDVVGRDHWARAAGFVTLVRVPLTYNGILEGGITLASCRPRQVTADDEQLYRTLADQLSIVVHNLIEYERVREMRRDAIFRLAVACEVRDPETVAHLQRIYALTQELGRELGIAGGALEDLALSSVLHDAGKIRTPDTILWKPGLLGEEELAIVRLHTMHGEQLLAGPEFYATARQIARHHHERWDGSGYPDGLAGEAIPLPARIVAVADVFDALTARRVYRPAWPEERAAREIIAQAGRLFDPRVVAAFEALYRADRLPPRALGSA